MSEQLIVRIGSHHNDPVLWCVWSMTEQVLISSGELVNVAQLHTLKQRAGQRPITALVPVTDLHVGNVPLPNRPTGKILAALPFMLEDDLAGDIEDHFFAYHKYLDGHQQVVAVDREKMQYWLSLFTDAGLVCQRMLPDALTLPQIESQTVALNLGEQWLLKHNDWDVTGGELDWLLPVLQQNAQQTEQPLALTTLSNIEDTPLTTIEGVVQKSPELPIQVLASGVGSSKFNLLQGEFKLKRELSKETKQWRWVAMLALVTILLHVSTKGIEAYQLSAKTAELTNQIASAYKKGFPKGGAPKEGIMRRQIATQLSRLGSGSNDVTFLSYLTEISTAFTTNKVRPQTMKFDAKRNELRIQVIGKDFRSLEQFKNSVQQLGYDVTQGAINNKEDFVIGSMSIRS